MPNENELHERFQQKTIIVSMSESDYKTIMAASSLRGVTMEYYTKSATVDSAIEQLKEG